MAKIGNRKILLSLIVFLTLPLAVRAEPTVTARVSATEVNINSQLMLSIEVSGISNLNGTPNLSLPDFEIQPAGQTSSFQWINGQSSSLITLNYVLTPTKSGSVQIPPISLNVDGKSYTTQPITIQVRPDMSTPTVAPQNNEPSNRSVQVPAEGIKPLFMTATVDSDKVVVGQQILLKVQFLKRPDIRFTSQARYTAPDMTGFLVEPLKQQEYSTSINGVRYDVTELPYALFPTSDGEFAIGSARVELAIRAEPDPFDPNSFFQNFFGRSQVVNLNTRAIPIRVRALPANKPTNFSGAVGRFKIKAKVDANQFEVGKPFNLLVTVEGVGNIKAIKEPTFPDLRGFRRYETISDSKVSTDNKFVNGSKEFKILLIPQVSGQLTIPPISFVYYSPTKNDYVTEVTSEIPLQVKPGTLNQAEGETSQPGPAGQTLTGVRVMEKDIRFIKAGKVRPMKPPFYRRPLFIVLNFLPPLFAFVAFLSRRQSLKRIENATEYRAKGAFKSAKEKLNRTRKSMNTADAVTFYGNLHAAMAGFIADKFSVSVSGLIWEEVEQKLKGKNVSPSLIKDIHDIFDQADMARFATTSFTDESRESALTRANELLKQLDEALK
ncbi:MAG: hypothetical protein KCHDKBKB_00018 [Elusimicrobia bacterium]|nr:hypothetical protein [Elusimicrobiota bacterium]